MGVGIAIKDPAIFDKKNWAGQNFMGEILERIRQELK